MALKSRCELFALFSNCYHNRGQLAAIWSGYIVVTPRGRSTSDWIAAPANYYSVAYDLHDSASLLQVLVSDSTILSRTFFWLHQHKVKLLPNWHFWFSQAGHPASILYELATILGISAGPIEGIGITKMKFTSTSQISESRKAVSVASSLQKPLDPTFVFF